MEGPTCIFAPVISREEWDTVPRGVASKIEDFVNEKFQEFITTRALLETNKFNAEQALEQFQSQHESVCKENEELKARLDAATAAINELESQLSIVTNDVTKLQLTCNRLEAESADFRHQRNLAVDERDEHLKMLQRRETEVQRLQSDMKTITKQFEQAVAAKCEALAQADEVASMKLRIEYREKRMDQERQLMSSQIESLTDDINQRTEELLNMRRDNTSRCIQLETKLTERTQELAVANDHIKSLTELNNNLSGRLEELAQKLSNQREADAKMNESYLHEIDAKTKLSNAYKSMCEESQQHSEGLKQALEEVQQLLQLASDKYGDLETKHKESELAHEEILVKKNECIAMLKKELEVSKELIENCKHEQLQKDIEGLSPTAASVSRFIKSGLTVTEIYTQYVSISEQLVDSQKDNAQLKNYINSIVQEVEEKGPLIKKLREDYSNLIDANETLKNHNDALVNEIRELREANMTCSRLEQSVERENARFKKEVNDLSRQVCHLLQEVEHSRVGSSSTSTDIDLSDSVSSADIITKKLVTFNDISELQKNNQKLLAVVRELTERQEEVESFDPAAVSEMQQKLQSLRESENELLEERDRQNKMMATLCNQRDMYKNLYSQAVKATGGEEGVDVTERPDLDSSATSSDDKTQELRTQIENLKKNIEQLKNENETYRKEKTSHDKILLDQLENMRTEVKDLVKLNCKLTSQLENCEEKFKVSQNNVEIYKKQINALEKQNRIYSETGAKHEQAISYLKDETMQSQTKLVRAEVMLGNLQKENALLKDSESRLKRERESLKRDSHVQNLMQTNIELIKATLERTDAEGKLRLEARLDEAHRECAALRRRLQEEQDRFRQLAEHLESQTRNAKERAEEEKTQADKLREELAETRDELGLKANQIEDLTKKLKTSAFTIPESNMDGRKINELEQQVSDCNAEISALERKLRSTREAADQYCDVATAAENQTTLLLERKEELEREVEVQRDLVRQMQERCSELEGELSIHMDDQDIVNATSKSRSHQLQEELSTATMDLQTARDQLENARAENKNLIEALKASENKYARQVTLHSNDLQKLTDMKNELDQAISSIDGVKQARDCALEELEQRKNSWQQRESLFEKEKAELEQRFKDLDSQNALLLDQIQALNAKLNIIQAQSSADQNQSMSDSVNKSFAESEAGSSDQLLTIIKYLRQEKDIAVSKAEIMEAEYERLKSQFESLNAQLAEAKSAIEAERQKSEGSTVTAAKHAEVLRKVETLNAITDSNRALRQERDAMRSQIAQLKTQNERYLNELAPLQEVNRELSIKAHSMQTENVSLRGECTRWRQRAQILIEKSNRTSPEDWKKLQGERETLAKQLTIERGNVAKLNDEVNTMRLDKLRMEEQIKNLRAQNNSQSEELSRLRDDVNALQSQVSQLTQTLEQTQEANRRILEENRLLTEDTAGKDVNITELKNNLTQIRKIAKKYKIQYEEQCKENKTMKEVSEMKETEQSVSNERQIQEQRTELEERIVQLEESNKQVVDRLNQDIVTLAEENDNYKKEIENLKQGTSDKEERFKALFKNAKDRIVTLSEQVNTLKSQLGSQEGSSGGDGEEQGSSAGNRSELLNRIENLEKEKAAILADKRQDTEKYASEIDVLVQKVTHYQRLLGQQGAKPSTSSGSSEKSVTEPPTANIKPMAGHSTNTQTQSVPIHPWRSAGETPLASIRPMSAQLRTVTVPPTSQSPSAVMVPPQQQVHTTGSSSIEALSSSPTSSHTDYVPATSSASSAMLGPRQVVVPPTQSLQDAEVDDDSMQVQQAPQQQQAVALVLPRVEPPTSGPTQEQGTSSSSSNTVTTTQAGPKRQHEPDSDQSDDQGTKIQPKSKRTRLQQAGTVVSDSGLEVEYQVPTSSQRDHDDDNVIVVESDDEGGADEGEGADDEPDDPDTEGYDMEVMEQDNYEDADCQDVEDEEEGGNEVEVIEDSSEVPNQSERSLQEEVVSQEEGAEQAQPEATSSGTDGGAGGVVSMSQSPSAMPSFTRARPIAPLPSRQQQQQQHHLHHHHFHQSHMLLSSSSSHVGHGGAGLQEEGGDDGIVPSTPTLFVPRRSDGFGEAVSSPHVPTGGRFTFNESHNAAASGSGSGASSGYGGDSGPPEHTLDTAILDDNSTGRSVPSTPLQASPQEAVPGTEDQGSSSQTTQSDAEIPSITVSGADDDEPQAEGSSEECMGPPSIAGTSSEGAQQAGGQLEENEGYDGVSSEGEKPPTAEGGEEEGREAEASPSTNTRSRSTRGSYPPRRTIRTPNVRGMSRSGPTPIVWGDQRNIPQQQRQQDMSLRGRGSPQSNYNPRMARMTRGRPRRYGRF